MASVRAAVVTGTSDGVGLEVARRLLEGGWSVLGLARRTAPIDHPESLMHGGNLLLRAQRDYPLAVRLLRRYLSNRL